MRKIYYINIAKLPTVKAHGYQICKMCEQMSVKGADLTLVAPRIRKNIQGIYDYYSLEANFSVKSVNLSFLNLLNFLNSRFYFYFFKYFFLSRLLFFSIPKDTAVYTRNPEIALIFKLRGFKTVLELHSLPNTFKRLTIVIAQRADKIVTVTRAMKSELLSGGVKENKILVEPDAVDLEKFDLPIDKNFARKKLSLPQNKKIIGYTGNFRTMGKDKGLTDLIKSLSLLSEDIIIVAVGGNQADIDYYKKVSEEEGVGKRVILRSRVPLAELAIFEKAFDVCAMPFPDTKHYRHYMSPLKMFEYMASQRPILATNLPSVREILNKDNAYLAEPNPEALARAIREIFSDIAKAEEKAQSAFRLVRNYTWSKRADRILNFIKTIES